MGQASICMILMAMGFLINSRLTTVPMPHCQIPMAMGWMMVLNFALVRIRTKKIPMAMDCPTLKKTEAGWSVSLMVKRYS